MLLWCSSLATLVHSCVDRRSHDKAATKSAKRHELDDDDVFLSVAGGTQVQILAMRSADQRSVHISHLYTHDQGPKGSYQYI